MSLLCLQELCLSASRFSTYDYLDWSSNAQIACRGGQICETFDTFLPVKIIKGFIDSVDFWIVFDICLTAWQYGSKHTPRMPARVCPNYDGPEGLVA